MTTYSLSLEKQHLLPTVQTSIPNPYQPTGKWRWLIASVVSLGGTGGVGYISIKSFITGTGTTGGILGAGSLICAGACAYCMYRFVNALRTRNIESITTVDDESAARATALVLRLIHNRLSALLGQNSAIGLELRVDDNRLQESINQQLTVLETLQTRNLEPVISVIADNANILLLQTIDSRLKTVLNIEQEEGLDSERLHESINQQLEHLEQLFPTMNQQLIDLQKAVQNVLTSTLADSQNSSGYNSPSLGASRENDLFARLDTLSKQVEKDLSSRNASRLPSAYSSPISRSKEEKTPSLSASRITEKPKAFNLDAIINASDSDTGD